MEKKPEISLLYDFYGELLKPSARRAVELYCNEDLSLSEVSEHLGISRQGVRDSLERSSKSLRDFEEKLGLLKAHRKTEEALRGIFSAAAEIQKRAGDGEIACLAQDIEKHAGELMETED